MNIQRNNMPIATPLKALWRWLMAEPAKKIRHQAGPGTVPAYSSARTLRPQLPSAPGGGILGPSLQRPLRVLRVMDADLAPAQIGRLRISGRMADVCAELDRLAAYETRLH